MAHKPELECLVGSTLTAWDTPAQIRLSLYASDSAILPFTEALTNVESIGACSDSEGNRISSESTITAIGVIIFCIDERVPH